MFDGIDSDEADRAIDAWQAGFERRAAQARELTGRMEHMTASARSQDGLVEVTVGRSGELTDLRLDEESRQRTAARTAREILATVAAARVALAEKMRDAVADTIGVESETGKAVLKGYQAEDDQA